MDKKQKTYTIILESGKSGISTGKIALTLGVTRAYAQRLAKELITDGSVVSFGAGPSVRYFSSRIGVNQIEFYKRLLSQKGLDEDMVYKEILEKTTLLAQVKDNVRAIFRYSFTEMLNNAIEHSNSDKIKIEVNSDERSLRFTIKDLGIGVFNNIKKKRNLSSITDAIAEVTKGKVTTMPKRHSGEGIFFTSRVVDSLSIQSSKKEVIFNNRVDDLFLRNSKVKAGSIITVTIDLNTKRSTVSVFRSFTNEAYEFDKTEILVKLFAIGNENEYISRSQARRVTEGLEKFSKITFDFKDVESVGQGFAHEIFAVWAKDHPKIEIISINANENVQFMISHAK